MLSSLSLASTMCQHSCSFRAWIGSLPADASERGAHVVFGNMAEHANDVVRGRRERSVKGTFNRRTGEGYVSPKPGDYARAQASGVRCVPLLVETKKKIGSADNCDWQAPI